MSKKLITPVDTQSEIDAAKSTLAASVRTKNEEKARAAAAHDNSRDALTQSILATVTPLVHLLNHGETESPTGQALPSERDNGIRIYLGQVIQTICNQLYGYTVTSTGKKVSGQLEWLNEAEHRVNSPLYVSRAEQDNLSDADLKAWHFFEVQEARVAMMTEHLRTFKAVYLAVTGEEWKPYVATASTATKESASNIAAKAKEKFGRAANA